jgi:hypothetical protein
MMSSSWSADRARWLGYSLRLGVEIAAGRANGPSRRPLMRLGASWVQGFKRGDVSRHQAGMVPASLTPLDDARALAQLDQVLWVHARGFAIRAAGNQHVDDAGENLVGAV